MARETEAVRNRCDSTPYYSSTGWLGTIREGKQAAECYAANALELHPHLVFVALNVMLNGFVFFRHRRRETICLGVACKEVTS